MTRQSTLDVHINFLFTMQYEMSLKHILTRICGLLGFFKKNPIKSFKKLHKTEDLQSKDPLMENIH